MGQIADKVAGRHLIVGALCHLAPATRTVTLFPRMTPEARGEMYTADNASVCIPPTLTFHLHSSDVESMISTDVGNQLAFQSIVDVNQIFRRQFGSKATRESLPEQISLPVILATQTINPPSGRCYLAAMIAPSSNECRLASKLDHNSLISCTEHNSRHKEKDARPSNTATTRHRNRLVILQES